VNRLVNRLTWARNGRRLLLVGYLPAGYPDGSEFGQSVGEAFEAGADAMEIALPNPPLPMDGPLIQEAVRLGALNVEGPEDALRRAVDARVHPFQSIIALAYRATVDELGTGGLLRICVDSGVDALLLPQHTVLEQLELAVQARAVGLEQVIFLHLEEDLPVLAASGLERLVIYLQSADVQTGGGFIAGKAAERLDEVREALGDRDAFVLVGFGIRGPDEADALVGSSADGVIVGTAMVEAARQGGGAVRDLVRSIQPALPKLVAGGTRNG
jgi:tryptophan synthase alpha chain